MAGLNIATGQNLWARLSGALMCALPYVITVLAVRSIMLHARIMSEITAIEINGYKISAREIYTAPFIFIYMTSGMWMNFFRLTIARSVVISYDNGCIVINGKNYLPANGIYKFDIIKKKFLFGYPQDKVRYLVFRPFHGPAREVWYTFREKQADLARTLEQVAGIEAGRIDDPKS